MLMAGIFFKMSKKPVQLTKTVGGKQCFREILTVIKKNLATDGKLENKNESLLEVLCLKQLVYNYYRPRCSFIAKGHPFQILLVQFCSDGVLLQFFAQQKVLHPLHTLHPVSCTSLYQTECNGGLILSQTLTCT